MAFEDETPLDRAAPGHHHTTPSSSCEEAALTDSDSVPYHPKPLPVEPIRAIDQPMAVESAYQQRVIEHELNRVAFAIHELVMTSCNVAEWITR
ncbi:MAG: hypothetical protein RMJ56_08620 [Gemmataceae bacterium]|nr:hypothetical protein [Gemmata sp.]MDW8197649.1 hypothetical protein [Gemmataceae bacterium]